MKEIPIPISEFDYQLDEDRIAKYPVSPRDASRLLFYNEGVIENHTFSDISNLLPGNSTLFLNDTRVINARLFFEKDTGALIEILLLDPVSPSETSTAMIAKGKCIWKCMIGNLKKWKTGNLELQIPGGDKSEDAFLLKAELIDRQKQLVEFSWDSELTFSQIVSRSGSIPLPPYLKRKAESEDEENYQTIYSKTAGAIAAPTAGLHFSEGILADLNSKGIPIHYLTLHVSAGTFQPVEVENIKSHPMHQEEIILNKHLIEKLLNSSMPVAVGTTSLRTMESIYWLGVQLLNGDENLLIRKSTPYQFKTVPLNDALGAVLSLIQVSGKLEIPVRTELFIYPGYQFQICKGLITNFHLPKSSLLMLVSAFIGQDWKKVYQHALQNDYRFLSFGDSSLLLPKQNE